LSSKRGIYTIGHSTRSFDEFLALLQAHEIKKLGDIRTVPRSRRHPHFSGEALGRSLAAAGITYRHFPGLGGLRKPRPHSPNAAWRVEGFRGYADYMSTAEFEAAVDELMNFEEPNTVVMCAEAVWWRCHRQLLADALVARGVEVRHIVSTAAPTLHTLTDFAHVIDGRVSYGGLLGTGLLASSPER
jgi:uncharacterized protein (DUF488 family)